MKLQDTFIDQHAGMDPHLYAVVAVRDDGGILAFNFTDHETGPDDTCVVAPHEHVWLWKTSQIYYRGGQIWSADAVASSLARGIWRVTPPITDNLLERIRRGAFESRQVKGAHRDFLLSCGYRPIEIERRRVRKRTA